MSGPTTFSGSTFLGGTDGFRCMTGFIVRAEEFGFIQRGTHRLVTRDGRVLASLSSNRVNLFALEGQLRTVCGFDEGEIEGVVSLRVTQVLPVNVPGTFPPPTDGGINLALILLLLILGGRRGFFRRGF